MAITQQTPYNNYTGNGSTTVFAYTFKLFLASDLKVYLDGVLQTETTHYTVSGVGTESGGNVTFVAAPASSVAVQLVRSIPYNRLVDYQTSGDLLANTLDDDLDRVVAQVQQLEQAAVDSVSAPLPGANYDAGGRRIVNLADPVDAQDAMTYASALASVTAAAQSAADAQTAQTAAELAETNAAAAQAAAEAVLDSFDDRYLGAKAADPTLGNDGNALVTGALYFNTVSNVMRMYDGASWRYNNAIPDSTITADKLADASVTNAKLAFDGGRSPYAFFKSDTTSVAFTKTAAQTLSIKAGTFCLVGDTNTMVSWSTATAVVMPALTGGTDYAIYACTDGTVRADASFTAPTGYTTSNSRKIGGFHYGLVAPGTTVAGGSFATTGNGMIWTQTDVDKIAGINQYSLWDLKWRPQCDPKGMALVAGRVWVDIYFCGTNHPTNGTSKAGTDIASGTVLPKKPLEFGGDGTTTYASPKWWDFVEIVNAYKKRLMREQEFVLAAFGVTENQSIDAGSSTYPTTQRNAGYTSKYGIEQASGHHWIWGEDTGQYGESWAYANVNGGRGQIYTTSYVTKVILGGARGNGAYSGSRCSHWYHSPWLVAWSVGVRAACDHLTLL